MNNINTDLIEKLFNRTLKLFPNTSLDDFMDEFDVSGYYDLLARINIQEEQLNELRRLGGKSLLRMKYDLHRSGLLTNNYVERIRELQRSEYFK